MPNLGYYEYNFAFAKDELLQLLSPADTDDDEGENCTQPTAYGASDRYTPCTVGRAVLETLAYLQAASCKP